MASIWDFPTIKNLIHTNNYYSLSEGHTPIEEVEVQGTKIYIKREDLNPTGSFKDRGTAFKLTELLSIGVKELVISSSGNAAISFMTYGNKFGFKVNAVVSPTANPVKLEKLRQLASTGLHNIQLSKTPRRTATQIALERKVLNLRTSTDPIMPVGYRTIMLEIENQGFTDIFVPTSSGTALIGMYQGRAGNHIAIHACQTSAVHTMAEGFMQPWQVDPSRSLADAIVDGIGLRKQEVVRVIKETGGYAWIISNQELQAAQALANPQLSRPLSYTSALSVASYLKAKQVGRVGTKVLCLASGT